MSGTYRKDDVAFLMEHVRHNHSIELVGMRRVGINNFLRHFFLLHQYGKTDKQMYIFIDLNNLVEREAFPFWQLTLKRISDAVRDLVTDPALRREMASIFESAIQYQNLQMTYDGVREALTSLVKNDIEPVIFFNRFDRVINMMSESFIDNIYGLYDAAGNRLSCVFTSYRPLADFYKKKLPIDQFYTHYLVPLNTNNAEQHIEEYQKKYKITFNTWARKTLIPLAGGHVQYLRLLMDILRETKTSPDKLADTALKDERVLLLSEELWDSLTDEEKNDLKQITKGVRHKVHPGYLSQTGVVTADDILFSDLFVQFIKHKSSTAKANGHATDFTRKEHLLFNLLKQHLGAICERDQIIEKVWSESAEDGISDWSIDKLMERLREKIKKQGLKYQVVTVRTRGYKMVEN